MIKSDLRKLRTLYATRQMIEKAKADDGTMPGTTSKFHYSKPKRNYGYYMRCQCLNGYIKVAAFRTSELKKGKKEPEFEVFLNPKGDEFITRYWKKGEEVWSNAMLWNLPMHNWNYFYDSVENGWMNQEGSQTIRRQLQVNCGGFDGIYQWQQRIRKEELEQKMRREVAPWDEDMELVPELPKSFERWWQKEVIEDNYIFYHYKKKGAKEGYCSYCERIVPIKNPKHCVAGKCPRCRREITYRSNGKIKTLNSEAYYCQLIQEVPGGVVIREFRVRKYYKDSKYTQPCYQAHESTRTFLRNGHIIKYTWDLYRGKYYRWVETDYHKNWHSMTKVYKRNMTSLAKKALKHSGLPIIVKKDIRIDAAEYLYDEAYNPALEKLVKAGLLKLASEIQNIDYDVNTLNQNETKLAKMLKIDNARLKRLKSINSGLAGLYWMQREKKADTIYPDALIEYMDKNDIEPKQLTFIFKKMSEQKIFNYIRQQQKLLGISAQSVITKWRDYLNMAVRAHMQTCQEQIYKPKNIDESHNELILLLQQEDIKKQEKELAKKWTKVNEVCKTLGKYEYAKDDYLVIAPKGIEDIIKEGITLRHCIHTCDFYFDRINTKESYLLFLRKASAPNVPWYTLEIEPGGNIRQKRTLGDNQNPDFQEAVPFLKKWQKEINKRLTKEDKELAKKSNQARLDNYKELRENGNRIWHGKLQGQLLADVLEADFMATI